MEQRVRWRESHHKQTFSKRLLRSMELLDSLETKIYVDAPKEVAASQEEFVAGLLGEIGHDSPDGILVSIGPYSTKGSFAVPTEVVPRMDEFIQGANNQSCTLWRIYRAMPSTFASRSENQANPRASNRVRNAHYGLT
eukprot:4991259-Pleurochrysis_carterae.AAC.2